MKLGGYIGIDTLTEQIRKKSMRQGFEFNIMVVGECSCHCNILVLVEHYKKYYILIKLLFLAKTKKKKREKTVLCFQKHGTEFFGAFFWDS